MEASDPQRAQWLRDFAAHLRGLQPSIRAEQAHEVAELAFESASDMVPEDVATVFGDVLNAKVPVDDLKRWAHKLGRKGAR